jgi:hypothetical protein
MTPDMDAENEDQEGIGMNIKRMKVTKSARSGQ